MGGCQLGGYGWGIVSDKDLERAVGTALDQGINFFDTADTYGLGKSERILGKALKENRNQVVIGTKFGVRIKEGKTFYDNSPDWIKSALEASLKRLNTDYIDLYQIHYRDKKTDLDLVVDTLEDLKAKGYIRYYGLSNINQKDITEISKFPSKFVSFQNEYSLACRSNEKDIIQLAEELKLTPITWGSLGQGILSGKYSPKTSFGEDDRRHRDAYMNFHGEKLRKNLEIVEVMKDIAREINQQLPAIAIRFILDNLKDSVVIAGVKDEKQLLVNIHSMDFKLDKVQLQALLHISDSGEAV